MSDENTEEEEDKQVEDLTTLLKAGPSKKNDDTDNDDDDDDDYDEKFMAKHKRYMKKMDKRNDKNMPSPTGGPGGYMGKVKKAYDNFVKVSGKIQDEAITQEADAVLVEGTAFMKAFTDLGDRFKEVIEDLSIKVSELESKLDYSNALHKASSEVLLKANTSLEIMAKTPNQVRSAQTTVNQIITNDPLNSDGSSLIQKAKAIGIPKAKQSLLKAAMNGNNHASGYMTQVESCYGHMELLEPPVLNMIINLAEQETTGGSN